MDGKIMSSSAWTPQGVVKSNSTASGGARSTKSHDSVNVLGSHPLGTLRVHQPGSPLPRGQPEPLGIIDDEPPPLAAGPEEHDGQYTTVTSHVQPPGSSNKYRTSPPRDVLVHGKGGGDVVLILDLPDVFNVGYDAVSFTAKHFGGVRDVPAGPHFFWLAHPDGVSARCGFWIISSGVDHVHVMQWNRFNETLTASGRAEARIQADNLDQFHSKLIPYRDPTVVAADPSGSGQLNPGKPEKNLMIWKQLTGSITKQVLNRVTETQSDSWEIHTGDRVNGAFRMAGEAELDKKMKTLSRQLNFIFTHGSRTFSTDLFGAARTLEATDTTTYITSMILDPARGLEEEDLVGELQLAYIVGMHLGNDACIQQWWHMVLHLVLKAFALPARRPALAVSFLRTLVTQLSYGAEWLDGSILDYSEANSRDLRLALIIYKRRLDELLEHPRAASALMDVGAAFSRLESIVTGFGWDIRGQYLRKGKIMMEDGEEIELEMEDLAAEDERGEWAPEVVDIDEHGRQRDLVSWTD